MSSSVHTKGIAEALGLIGLAQPVIDRKVLVRTLYGEARGERQQGMHGVANVILNRVKRPGWWTRERDDGIADDTIAAACLDPWQFSCWNKNDPNRDKLIAIRDDDMTMATAAHIAGRALAGTLPDLTAGATHYHTKAIKPYWARGREPCAVIGNHLFYRED